VRIVVFSDPHVDINSRILQKNDVKEDFIDVLVDNLDSCQPDVLICAGDITPETSLLKRTLATIKDKVKSDIYLFIPGNHDIWFRKPADNSELARTSLDKYQRVIPEICREIGFRFLPNNPLAVNKLGFLGSIGWYDYSFRNTKWDKKIDLIHYAAKRYEGMVWNDVNYGEWGMSDASVCQYLLSELEKDYKFLSQKEIEECFLVLHHVPFRQFVKYKDDLKWDFFSSFIGSQKFGEWALNHPKIRSIAFGHTHFPQTDEIGGITNYCVPIGYLSDVKESLTDLYQFIKSRITVCVC
jgi:putative phosphoesterase